MNKSALPRKLRSVKPEPRDPWRQWSANAERHEPAAVDRGEAREQSRWGMKKPATRRAISLISLSNLGCGDRI